MSAIYQIRRGNVNCHIIVNGTDGILVDTGKREHLDRVIQACAPYRIRLILLTHGHFDHAENAARLSETLGAPIGMSEKDLDLIGSNMAQSLSAHTVLGKMVLSASLKEFGLRNIPAFVPDVLLQDGGSLMDYGLDGRVIALPGHTRGSIGVDVEGRYLLVGDALMDMFYPTVSMLYHDREAMLDSARRIGGLGARTIYFGHGGPRPNRRWAK